MGFVEEGLHATVASTTAMSAPVSRTAPAISRGRVPTGPTVGRRIGWSGFGGHVGEEFGQLIVADAISHGVGDVGRHRRRSPIVDRLSCGGDEFVGKTDRQLGGHTVIIP
jgi:hypothetical protein